METIAQELIKTTKLLSEGLLLVVVALAYVVLILYITNNYKKYTHDQKNKDSL